MESDKNATKTSCFFHFAWNASGNAHFEESWKPIFERRKLLVLFVAGFLYLFFDIEKTGFDVVFIVSYWLHPLNTDLNASTVIYCLPKCYVFYTVNPRIVIEFFASFDQTKTKHLHKRKSFGFSTSV